MPYHIEDRVLELSTSVGTGAFALAGALTGYRAMAAVYTVADTLPYYIEAIDADGQPSGEFEFGMGTYSAANELTRTSVRGSSNANAVVAFAPGSKVVGVGVPAPASTAARREWRRSLIGPVKVLTPAASIAVDADDAITYRVTLDQNSTLANPTNLQDGDTFTFIIENGASWTLAFGSKFEWLIGSAPTITTGAGAKCVVSGVYDATDDVILSVWQGQ